MPGTLVFKPIEANLNVKDQDILGKMDPYCLFHVGGHRVKSQIAKSGGQNPHWQDAITVEMPTAGGVVQVDLKDKDMLIDDKLGSFELDLNEVASLGQVRKWYPIFSKDRPAGEILLETTYNGGHQQGLGQQGFGQGHFVGGGIPTTQSTTYTKTVPVPTGGQTVLSEIHGNPSTHGNLPQQQFNQGYPQQQFNQGYPQQGNFGQPQSTMQSGGQPLTLSGVQPTVIPVGGVGSGVEQYAVEALMRGVDPLNSQQHYYYNAVNGSQTPGYSGIPMNYSSGVSGKSAQQYPQNLTQTPCYSGSQPMMYEGNAGHAEVFTNTHTTGHHNEGYMSKLQQKEAQLDQKFGTHKHTVDQKNPITGDFHKSNM